MHSTTSKRLKYKVKGIKVEKNGKIEPKSATPGKGKGINCQAD